jgi:hypothetical protein
MRFIVQTMNRNDNTKMTFGIEPLGHMLHHHPTACGISKAITAKPIRCSGLDGELRALVK